MDNDNEYIKVRREKIQKLRDEGINPFKNDIKPSIHIIDLIDMYAGTDPESFEKDLKIYSIVGRITAIRSFGSLLFRLSRMIITFKFLFQRNNRYRIIRFL